MLTFLCFSVTAFGQVFLLPHTFPLKTLFQLEVFKSCISWHWSNSSLTSWGIIRGISPDISQFSGHKCVMWWALTNHRQRKYLMDSLVDHECSYSHRLIYNQQLFKTESALKFKRKKWSMYTNPIKSLNVSNFPLDAQKINQFLSSR